MKPAGPETMVSKIVGICFTLLLGAMALYGAVQIISAVWVPLCVGVAAVAGLWGAWLIIQRWRGW